MYDSHNQDMMIVLYNTSDYEIAVRNSGTAIKFGFWTSKVQDWQQGTTHLDYKSQEVF